MYSIYINTKKIIVLNCIIVLVSCSAHSSHVFQSLEGTWKLATKNIEYDYSNKRLPEYVEINIPCSIKVPHTFENNNMQLPVKGYVWIQKEIFIESLPTCDLALQFGEIMNADVAYFNGKQIGASGRFPPDFKSAWGKFRHYAIPRDIINKGANVIVLKVYYDSEFWITPPVRLIDNVAGSKIASLMDFLRIQLMENIFILLILLSFFFIMMFYFQREYMEYLLFGIACFTIAMPQSLHFLENLYPDIGLTSDTILKLTQPGLILFPAFLNLFYRYHIGKQKKWLTIVYIAVPIVFSAIMVLQQTRAEILFYRNLSIIVSIVYMIDLFILSGWQVLHKKKAGTLIFIGLVPMVVLGMHDILSFGMHIIPSYIVLYVYGLPFLIFIISIYLVNIFVKALKETQELNIQLQKLLLDAKRLAYLEKELEIAKAIQSQLLPSKIPDIEGVDIAVKFQPAMKIGGDIYNIFQIKDGVVLFVADVVGHGIPAALISAMVNVLLKMFQMLAIDPGLLLRSLNVNICTMLPQTFVTAVCVYCNRSHNFMRIARAGHPPMIKCSNDGNISMYMPSGRALGIQTQTRFKTVELTMEKGDRLIIYTDGLVEASLPGNSKDIYGEERLKNMIQQTINLPLDKAIEVIYDDVISYVGSHQHLTDDITVIMIEIL